MSDYHKAGTTLRDYVVITDPGGSLVTGLVQGDMTIQVAKNAVGNQALTGLTFTEIDAANNPGSYAVEVDGSSGFAAATGAYEVFLYRTADGEEYGYTFSYVVTSDGTGAGTWGDAAFSATSGDGRFTDGSNPLEGVTVWVTNSAGALLLKTETDAAGLIPTVYFSADGVYAFAGQKGGYSAGLYTVTVSGTTATGPGADEVLTATSSSSNISASELLKYAIRAYYDHTGDKADDEALEIVNDAITRVSDEYHWPFMHQVVTITLRPIYKTGTLTLTQDSNTVELDSGVFPSWAASADLYIDGQFYPVATRTDDTHVELVHPWGAATIADKSYQTIQIDYAIPDRCTMIDEILWPTTYRKPNLISKALFEVERNRNALLASGYPSVWSFGDQKISVLPAVTEDSDMNVLFYRTLPEVTNVADVVELPRFFLSILRKAINVEACMRAGGESAAASLAQAQREYQLAIDKTIINFSQEPVDGEILPGNVYDDGAWLRDGGVYES